MLYCLQVRKPDFGGLRTAKARTSLNIGAFDILTTSNKQNFKFLASLCSWAAWFGYDLVGNPKDRFSCEKATIIIITLGGFHSPILFILVNVESLQ